MLCHSFINLTQQIGDIEENYRNIISVLLRLFPGREIPLRDRSLHNNFLSLSFISLKKMYIRHRINRNSIS